jgi:amidase
VPDDLLFAPATRLLALLRAREISACELVDAHLAQIARVNPGVNAIVTLTADAAREDAAEADRRLARGDPRPLEGLPITIKDSIEVAGVRCTAGSKLFEHYVPATDAVTVARLRAAGGVVLGKTNLPELALDFDCENPVFGRTSNPWDATRVPGGSSGGEAAALATGCSVLGLGSDLAGSVRIPAHFCGVTALKPTLEAIPRTGHMPPGIPPLAVATMATIGPMARSVDDLALAYELLRGPDPSDPYILPGPGADAAPADLHGLRCAFFVDGGPTPVAAPIREMVRRAARSLADAGLSVDERTPPGLADAHRVLFALVLSDGGVLFKMLAGERYPELRPALRRMLESVPPLSGLELLTEAMHRDGFRAGLARFLSGYPVILAPTLPIAAFRHDHDGHDIEGIRVSHTAPLWGTDWVNVAGLPAVAVPAGTTPEGLPIGVQIVGRPFAERQVLAVAALLERALGGYRRPPGY